MPAKLRKFLRPGEFYVGRQAVLAETLVGSCVTVCLYNVEQRFGMMNHFLLGFPPEGKAGDIGHYGTTATSYIIEASLKRDSDPKHYGASIFGGAAVLKTGSADSHIGETNVGVAVEMLRNDRIRVARQETGGTRGRRVTFDTETGEITCRFAGDIPRKHPPRI